MDTVDWIDITVPFAPSTPPWPGDTALSCGWVMRTALGDSVNVSAFTVSPHLGTHADAPLHVQDGAAASETIPLSHFNGVAYVVDVESSADALTLKELPPQLLDAPPTRLLLRTGRSVSHGTFPDSWPWLDHEAAQYLIAHGLLLLGTDTPSVDARTAKTLKTHAALFAGGAFVVENLDLRHVEAGRYELRAMPMRIDGLDAAPVRALLRALPVTGRS